MQAILFEFERISNFYRRNIDAGHIETLGGQCTGKLSFAAAHLENAGACGRLRLAEGLPDKANGVFWCRCYAHILNFDKSSRLNLYTVVADFPHSGRYMTSFLIFPYFHAPPSCKNTRKW